MSNKSVHLDKYQFVDDYIKELKRCLDRLDRKKISEVIELLIVAYKKGKKIFILGNGGSASNASHIACDLGKGTLLRHYDDNEKRFRVISLTDNVAYLTALANDISYEDIFVQQLRNLVDKGDLVMVLSGSGNSSNVIKAVKYAKKKGALTIGFLGFEDGGKLGKMVDTAVIVDSRSYGPCEDIQLVLDHIITGWISKIKGRD
ncbi:hypothetical protein A2773_03465 [Candidatus Gottesmanbacteria bacterium RIFCSPHIGHO2_01_FULL_39_10]|uniref:SIS domain-containing protein n=1 Tax=Candidatus Gottesmanbacteria bacterium RIFCSPHIGHO2_01_FULL_39_10 TaxID=1798375 RepID=A0A1F5ZPB2_9BACT|nr:MAG: hypothetical protein A2773_03465 [Candidatus Gottesmanbacteria bacterium RIFCSPHIGHO2_01_FULL_39_10]